MAGMVRLLPFVSMKDSNGFKSAQSQEQHSDWSNISLFHPIFGGV